MLLMLFRRFLILLACSMSAMFMAASQTAGLAEQSYDHPSVSAVLTPQAIALSSVWIDGEAWIFLPAHGDMRAVRLTLTTDADAPLHWQGKGDAVAYRADEPVDWLALAQETETGVYSAALTREDTGESLLRLNIMQSSELRALYLWSDDPVQYGREWLEDCQRHERSATGSMTLISPDGATLHAGEISKLRGRGNGTWEAEKKGYQFKLDSKADLLDTGDRDERNKTWVLLANAQDPTMLRNRLAFDLGLELGLTQTSRSEFVDLYYDGEYRGTYLLCEKIEVASGRVDVYDYEPIINKINRAVGQTDLDALTLAEGENRFGNAFTYVAGLIESNQPANGSFLLELEAGSTLSDRCHFSLSDGSLYAVKSPENAGNTMMEYVSTRLEEAWQALQNRGADPKTGETLEAYFDLSGFARTILIQELGRNFDGFRYSSTFFVLPAGMGQFQAGPLWDFDFAFAPSNASVFRSHPQYQDSTGFKETEGWLPAFYSCESFRKAMKLVCEEELYPIVQNILLGEEQGRYLQSINDYAEELTASQQMNYRLWPIENGWLYIPVSSAQEGVEQMTAFIAERTQWLYDTVMSWGDFQPDRVTLKLDAAYTQTSETLRLLPDNPSHNGTVLSLSSEMLKEATEESYALWQAEAIIAPLPGYPFGDAPTVSVNGVEVGCEALPDGTLRILIAFEDLSYRPVDYYGEDLGLVYDYDSYTAQYPEVAAECGYDPEAVLEYFYYDGMLEGHKGNAFFDPHELYLAFPEISETLGEDWSSYYLDFMTEGHTIFWMTKGLRRYTPTVTDMLAQ